MAAAWWVVLVAAVLRVVVSQDLGRPEDDPRGLSYGSDQRWRNILRNTARIRNRYSHP